MLKITLTLTAMLLSTSAFAETPKWTVSETTGSVVVLRAGLQAAAVRGGTVNGGDSVSTGKNGRAVLVRGEEFLVVSSNSRIVIADPALRGRNALSRGRGKGHNLQRDGNQQRRIGSGYRGSGASIGQ